jgi:hypothetical protein
MVCEDVVLRGTTPPFVRCDFAPDANGGMRGRRPDDITETEICLFRDRCQGRCPTKEVTTLR